MIKRSAAVLLSILMCLALLTPVRAEAASGTEAPSLLLSAADKLSGPSYDDYLREHGDPAGQLPDREIVIDAASVLPGEASYITSYAGRDAVLYWDAPDSACRWNFTAEEAGYYQLAFTFAGISDKSYDIIVDLKLDGKVPYENTENLKLRRTFLDETYFGPEDNAFDTNLKGDELMPTVVEQIEWQTQTAMDAKSFYSDPLLYYLSEGTHEIELTLKEEAFALASLTFEPRKAEKLRCRESGLGCLRRCRYERQASLVRSGKELLQERRHPFCHLRHRLRARDPGQRREHLLQHDRQEHLEGDRPGDQLGIRGAGKRLLPSGFQGQAV